MLRSQKTTANHLLVLCVSVMAGAAEVEAVRSELLQLREDVQQAQADYQSQARARVAQQQTMARIVQTVQEKTHDVALVEDVIIVSLKAETAARRSRGHIPAKPVIDPNSQPRGRTASAEEAIAVYKSQLAILQQEMEYLSGMLHTEIVMAEIYQQGNRDIVDTMKSYSNSPSLTDQIESMAAV